MAAQQPTLPGIPEPDPRPSDTDRVRDAIAGRAQRMDVRFPRACDLEAEVLVALQGPLRGVASLLSGTHCPEHWREMLRGERSMPAGDLYRLATEPTREAREAVTAALDVLERNIGRVAVPILARPRGTLAGGAGEHAAAATELLAAIARALEDGKFDEAERSSVRAMVATARKTLAAVEAHLLDEDCR